MKLKMLSPFGAGLFFIVVNLGSGVVEGSEVSRELDCRKDPGCIEVYQKLKSAWLECLEGAGLPERKRKILSSKVERLGIRNLKKSEILIFDSKRKACHKSFSKALSEVKAESGVVRQWPAPIDRLQRLRPGSELVK